MKYGRCLFLAGCLLLTACAENVSPNTYQVSEVGRVNRVVSGVILAKRYVNIDGNSHKGGLAGVIAGAFAGANLGNDDSTNAVGAVGGGVLGGLAGNAIDKAVNNHHGFEYIIKLKKGSTISVVQDHDLNLCINQRVLVIYGKMTRIIADDSALS